MPAAPGDPAASGSGFWNLRGIRWRVDLGILPCSPASINDLRRAAADSRRGYANLRRRILIDPYLSLDGSKSSDLAMDNPLSQSPDSSWGRFFRNAELEKIVDQDLSRLYPGNNAYFRTPTCQSMLRRILISWCLGHPDYGYRQGMHELLAPLLYVLHVDLQHFSQVQELFVDYFKDDFSGFSGIYFQGSNMVSDNRFKKAAISNTGSNKANNSHRSALKCSNLDELDPDTRDVLLLTDAYGAEGELGIILSERFMEHDAYCMFDSLMNGALGVVAMADFFSPSPATGSSSGLPPIIEASSALYHLLSIVDSSLHGHLVELGVEPQFFALRWLRVLFGREFLLEDLLVIWDEIFSSTNSSSIPDREYNPELNFRVLWSPRGAYISAMAVSMLLHLRSSLLTTDNATTCLQRLVNFPENVDMRKLIEKAKSLHALALDANICSAAYQGDPSRPKQAVKRGHSLSFGSISPELQIYSLPESYWEEKWRVMNRTDELPGKSTGSIFSNTIVKGFSGEKLGLFTAESDPSTARIRTGEKDVRSCTSQRLSGDLFQESDLKSDLNELRGEGAPHTWDAKVTLSMDLDRESCSPEEHIDQIIMGKNLEMAEEPLLRSQNSVLSTATSPRMVNDKEINSEKSSVTSTSSVAYKHDEPNNEESFTSYKTDDALLQECLVSATSMGLGQDTDGAKKHATVLKERKMLSGKFQWFRKFRGSGEGNSEKVGKIEAVRSVDAADDCKDTSVASTSNGSFNSVRVNERMEVGNKKVIANLRNLGKSILENIQVIEAVFLQDLVEGSSSGNSLSNIIEGRGHVAAMAALEEIRKISNLLTEM